MFNSYSWIKNIKISFKIHNFWLFSCSIDVLKFAKHETTALRNDGKYTDYGNNPRKESALSTQVHIFSSNSTSQY